jgi:hypothetical protein
MSRVGQQNVKFRDVARQLLDHERGQQDTALELAPIMEGAFRRFHKHMLQLIGQAGFQALLARAAHLTRKEAAWIESVNIQVEPTLTLTGLAECIESEGAAEVMEGLELLLANFIGLLCTFIGESLTMLLIRRIWPEVPLDDPGAGSKEGK